MRSWQITDKELLTIIGLVVAASEDQCRAGHDVKQDELTLDLWRQVCAHLTQRERGGQ